MYQDIEQDNEHCLPSSSLLEESKHTKRHSPTYQSKSVRWATHVAIHVLLLSVSVLTYHILVSLHSTSGYRYLYTTVEPKSAKLRFDGTFDRSSPYKGPPSPTVEKAWDDILPLHVMRISEEKFKGLNASKHAVKLPQEAGGGRMALFEAFHLVHCVRSLWQATYPDHYLKDDEYYRERIEEWREHIDHCADMLRQKLMCDADPTVITYNWLKKHSSPHPNFNVQHECRDYDALKRLAQADRVDPSMIPRRGKFDDNLIEFVEPPFDPEADE